jgi:hypothetical protein
MRLTDLGPESDRSTIEAAVGPAAVGHRDDCPNCGSPLVRDEVKRWINVARVTNLAEAGYLVDELLGDGVDARIYQSEDFSAATDRWQVSYLIQSPPQDAPSAAQYIRRHLAEMESYPEPNASDPWSDYRPALDPFMWRPVALVVLAGMASFVLGQRMMGDRDSKPPRNSLSGAVSAIGRPLVTEPAPGEPRHRLYYHRRDRAWYLDTDADADGRYESQQRFR